MGVKFANNAFGTLSAGITASATSITLSSGQGARFPTLSSGDYFYATLIDTSNNLEVIKVTARSSDVLTATRAQESTTARAFVIGDRIELRVTAQGLLDLTTVLDGDLDLDSNNITGTGNIDITGDADIDGAVTINDGGGDNDFRVESDTVDKMLFLDAGNNVVTVNDGRVTGGHGSKFTVKTSTNRQLDVRTATDTAAGLGIASTDPVGGNLRDLSLEGEEIHFSTAASTNSAAVQRGYFDNAGNLFVKGGTIKSDDEVLELDAGKTASTGITRQYTINMPTILTNGTYRRAWCRLFTVPSTGRHGVHFRIHHQGDHNYNSTLFLVGEIHQWESSNGRVNLYTNGYGGNQTGYFINTTGREIWFLVSGEWSLSSVFEVIRTIGSPTIDCNTYQDDASPPSGTNRSVTGTGTINVEVNWGS